MTTVIDFGAVRARKLAGLPAFDNAGLPSWEPAPAMIKSGEFSLGDRVMFPYCGAVYEGRIVAFTSATRERPTRAHVCSCGIKYAIDVTALQRFEP